MDNAYLIAAEWMALALIASLLSIRLGIAVALFEIGTGVIGGNFLGLHTTDWIDFLATFGAGLLTFLAGAEIDPESMRRHAKVSLTVGVVLVRGTLRRGLRVRLLRRRLGPCGS